MTNQTALEPGLALGETSVDAIIQAAATNRTVVVGHRMPSDAMGDAAALRGIAASVPRGWWVTCDGAVDPVTAACAADVTSSLPGDSEATIVTRLYHLQRVPAIQPLIDSVYDEVEAPWAAQDPWCARDAGLFVNSAGAVTSSHCDRHHNLLVQLSGSKRIGVAAPGSREHARVVAGSLPSRRTDVMPEGAETIELAAGQALYMPPFTVHWVESADDCVALSLGWSTAASVHAGSVYEANAVLQRRLRIPARPVGAHGDAVKLGVLKTAKSLRARTRRG